ncbi:MAG: hypothetical protein AB7E32_12785 [Desulfovibrio sp.]
MNAIFRRSAGRMSRHGWIFGLLSRNAACGAARVRQSTSSGTGWARCGFVFFAVAGLLCLAPCASAQTLKSEPGAGAPGVRTLPGFTRPTALAMDLRGNCYVAESQTGQVLNGAMGRISLIQPDGTRVLLAEGLGEVSALTVERNGSLLVAVRATGEVLRIRSDGSRTVLARELPDPVGLILDRDGGILVLCQGDGSLRRLHPTPSGP